MSEKESARQAMQGGAYLSIGVSRCMGRSYAEGSGVAILAL